MLDYRNPRHWWYAKSRREAAMNQNLSAISGKYPRTMKEAGMEHDEGDEPFPMKVLAVVFLIAVLVLLTWALML